MKKFARNSSPSYYRMVHCYCKTLKRTVRASIFVKHIIASVLASAKLFNWRSIVSMLWCFCSLFFFRSLWVNLVCLCFTSLCTGCTAFVRCVFVIFAMTNLSLYNIQLQFIPNSLFCICNVTQHHRIFLHRRELLPLKRATQQFCNARLMAISRLMFFGYVLESMN